MSSKEIIILCSSLQVFKIDGTNLIETKSIERNTRQVVWGQQELAAMDKKEITLYDEEIQQRTTLLVGDQAAGMSFDPHQNHRLATVNESFLKLWDTRTGALTGQCTSHAGSARCLDFNPNVPYQIGTSGEDAKIRLWDVRNLKECLKELCDGHRHWITQIAFNHVHDQLILTASTDTTVNLWRCGSITSRPLGSSENDRPDGIVQTFPHDDAVYTTTWGLADSWIFMSASYDGTIMVHQVPSEEKYRILL